MKESDYLLGWTQTQYKLDTHTAILINIQPIKEEAAEDLLREVCKYHDDFEVMMNAVNKARKFLENK